MRRPSSLFLAAASLACGWLAAGPAVVRAADESPNIVLILADDLGYGDLGCYGATHFATPHADRLAQEGMRFTDAHSPSAVCTPSRYALLTGRYCWRTWLKNWVLFERMPLLIDPERPTIGSMLQDAGYRTGCVGKWHLGWGDALEWDFANGAAPGPLEVGFDSFFGVPHSHNSNERNRIFVEGRRAVGLAEGESLEDRDARRALVRDLNQTATDLSAQAVEFIERSDERPFFLYYPTTNIHFPLTPAERFAGEGGAGIYGEFTVEFDWAIGQVLDALERRGVADNTLVILTSDNGGRPTEGMNGHQPNGPWRGEKRMIYEGGHRVPMIVRWPGKVRAGAESDEAVCLTDWFATIAGLVGRDVPADAGEDSANILPALLGEEHATPLRGPIVHHSVSGLFAIRSGKWKLIEGGYNGDYWRRNPGESPGKQIPAAMDGLRRDLANGGVTEVRYAITPNEREAAELPRYQLFDLAADPYETNDLAASRIDVVERLAEQLSLLRSSGRSVAR